MRRREKGPGSSLFLQPENPRPVALRGEAGERLLAGGTEQVFGEAVGAGAAFRVGRVTGAGFDGDVDAAHPRVALEQYAQAGVGHFAEGDRDVADDDVGVLRGGGYQDVAENCRLASRADALPAFGADAGLRICVPAPGTAGLAVDGRDVGLGAGEGWVCDGTTVSFLEDRTYEIGGSATGLALAVAADVSAAIVLRDATVVAGGAGSALSVAGGGSLELILAGANVLQGDAGQAGLRVETGAALAISGSGSLRVSGGSAGIGGNAGETSGSIVIRGGTIEASGASGVGTCPDGTCGAVVILGGSVHAIGGIAPGAVNGDSEPLEEVVVDLARPGQPVDLDGLDGYGLDGIQADENGRIYLYLPDGSQEFFADGVSYHAENGATGSVAMVNREAILILDVSEPNELGRIILYVDPVHAGLRVAIESAEEHLQTDGSFDWIRLGTYVVEEDGSIHDVPWFSDAEYYRIRGNPD